MLDQSSYEIFKKYMPKGEFGKVEAGGMHFHNDQKQSF